MERLTKFLTKCRQLLKNEENLFWVSLQSNLLADLKFVTEDFEKSLQEMKEEMKGCGWILPTLNANMRNQVNIANMEVKAGKYSREMQYSIAKLKSGTSLIGEVPILYQIKSSDWDKKKDKVLKHSIEMMSQKSEKNIVVLWDNKILFEDVAYDIKKLIKDKNVVAYPSKQSQEEGISNVKQFVEKSGYILVTEGKYFNGCESANVIFLTATEQGIRNSVLRGVQNILCVQLTGGQEGTIIGMKEDKRFLREGESENEGESESENDYEN